MECTSQGQVTGQGSYWTELLGAKVHFLEGRYRTRVIEAGSGEPLILLHGTGGHAENYVRNIMPLSAEYRVMAMDFLWHGKSDTQGFEPTVIPPLIDQVLDVLDIIGADRVYVSGQSLGGWVAMQLALQHPERIRKLVLTTPMGYVPDANTIPGYVEPDMTALRESSLAVLSDPTTENIRLRMSRILANPGNLTDEAVAVRRAIYLDPAVNQVQRRVIQHYLGGTAPVPYMITDALARKISVPTLVYWGDKNITPPAVGRRLTRQIPGAEFFCANETGHWAQFESFSDHNREVLRFLAA